MKYSVTNVGKFGVITDVDQTDLPPEAWTSVSNVRCQYNWIGTVGGYASISDAGDPFTGYGHYIVPLQYGANYYLVYPCDTDSDYDAETIYYFDGTNHTEITRAAGDYTGTKLNRWNGCNFQGIVILNNGVDAPQWWNGTGSCANMIWDGSNDWEDYDGAGATYSTQAIRAYKNFLMAMNINDNGTIYANMLHWSDAAEHGTMPATWNYALTTNLSGRVSVGGNNSKLLDGLSLKGSFILYKEDSAYICNYVGGDSIFSVDGLFTDRGIYSTDCVVDIGGKHVVLGDSSLYIHDGHSYKDILSGRSSEELFNDIEPSLYQATFLAHHRAMTEVWICYPAIGAGDADQCNKALVWNYETNAFTYREIPNIYHAITGISQGAVADYWDSETSDTWDSESVDIWAKQSYSPISDTLIGASDDLYGFESGNQFAGTNAGVVLERTGIDFGGPEDVHMITSIYPRIEGDALSIQIGQHDTVDSAVTWETAQTFTPGVTRKLDFRSTGHYAAVRFLSDADVEWKLNGYDLHYEFAGMR